MKKLIALLLALIMVMSLAACSNKEETAEEVVEETEEITEEVTEEVVEEEDVEYADTSEDLPFLMDNGDVVEVEDMEDYMNQQVEKEELGVENVSVAILTNIWAQYADEEKFPIMGGNAEAGVMDAPGVYDMTYAEGLAYQMVIPAEQLTNVAEAATMIHMMNANTFTCGVVKLNHGVDAAAFAAAVRDAIQNNQWMCGFPEQLVIADMGAGQILIAFGVMDAMSTFEANMTKAYEGAEILYSEAIAI